MTWVEVAVAFFVCHVVGDFLLQTDWQATHKRGGLGHDGTARLALVAHTATYTLAFTPAFVWMAGSLRGWTPMIVALVAIPHLIQDDRRLVDGYMRGVKGRRPEDGSAVAILVDQAFHIAELFAVALLVAALS